MGIILIILVVGLLVTPIILGRRGIGARYVYKAAFAVVGILFVTSLVFGIWTLTDPDNQTNLSAGMAGMFVLIAAVFLLPFVVVYGRKAFGKAEKEETQRAADEGNQSMHTSTGKTPLGLDEGVAGLLCYLFWWIGGILFILIGRENKMVRFHAMQSTITFGAITVVLIVMGVMNTGGFLIWVPPFILWIVLIIKASEGKRYKLPGIGRLAEKYAGLS